MPAEKLKRGPFSREEDAVLEKAIHGPRPMEAEEVAPRVRRSVASVRRRMEQLAMKKTREAEGRPGIPIAEQLKNRPEWLQFETQFSDEELDFFLYRYCQLMSQFGQDDVLATEELMIFQLISMEIVTNRTLADQKWAIEQRTELQAELEGAPRARQAEIRDQVAALTKQVGDAQKVYESNLKQTQSFLRDLKGVREQRVKVALGSKESFVAFLKALQEDDFRRATDEDIALVRRAAEKERSRLTAPHAFMDGAVEPPILTPEVALRADDAHV